MYQTPLLSHRIDTPVAPSPLEASKHCRHDYEVANKQMRTPDTLEAKNDAERQSLIKEILSIERRASILRNKNIKVQCVVQANARNCFVFFFVVYMYVMHVVYRW